MTKKYNVQIRTAAKNKGVFLYDVAEALGVSENTLTRWLRRELPDSKQREIIAIIDKLAAEVEEISA